MQNNLVSRIIAFPVQRPIIAVYIFSLICAAGIWTFFRSTKELVPYREKVFFLIETKYQDYPPFIVEQVITIPLEEQVMKIPGIGNVYSESSYGRSRLFIHFQPGSPRTEAMIELHETILRFSATLPGDSGKPVLSDYDPSQAPDFTFSFTSARPQQELRSMIEDYIVPVLKIIPGTVKIEVYGGSLKETAVCVHERSIDLYREIHRTIETENFVYRPGRLQYSGEDLPLYGGSRLKNTESLHTLFTPGSDPGRSGSLTRHSDIYLTNRAEENTGSVDGKPNVLIVLYLSKNTSILSEGKKVHRALDRVLSQYPELHGVTVHSRYQLIRDELIDLGKTLLAGIICLSVFAVVMTGSLRTCAVILLSIPFSLCGLSLALYYSGFSINVYTMLGAAIASGMLVDTAIIVLEYLAAADAGAETSEDNPSEDSAQESNNSTERAVRAVRRALRPLIIGFVTTAAVAVPVFLAPDFIKDALSGISASLIFGTLFSFIYSLFIIPVVYCRFFRNGGVGGSGLLLGKIDLILQTLVHFLCIRFESASRIILPIVITVCAAVMILVIYKGSFGITGISRQDQLHLVYEFNPGLKLQSMSSRAVSAAESVKQHIPGIAHSFISVEKYRADIRLSFDSPAEYQKAVAAVQPLLESGSIAVRDGFLRISGETGDGHSGTGNQVTVEITGLEYSNMAAGLEKAAPKLAALPDTQTVLYNFRNDSMEYVLKPGKDKIADNEIAPAAAAAELHLRKGSYIAGKYISGSEQSAVEEDIRLTAQNRELEADETGITFLKGRKINSFAEGYWQKNLPVLTRKNGLKTLGITVMSVPSATYGAFQKKIKELLKGIQLPARYFLHLRETGNLKGVYRFVVFYLLAVCYLLYAVTGSVYRSFTRPLPLMAALLTTLIIPVLIIAGSGSVIDISAIAALAAVLGIGINPIALVEELYADGFSVKNTFTRISASVIIGTLSTVCALLPAVFSANPAASRMGLLIAAGLTWNICTSVFIFPLFRPFFSSSPAVK